MDYMHSKDIYKTIRDVLKLLDLRVINHGTRTAYILYKMLLCQGKYEMFEIADLAFLATIHDIGSFKTDYMADPLVYETRDTMSHSIYGYLFVLYLLTPYKDMAKIILYHHTDYLQVPKTDYEYTDVIHMLNVAEKMDIYSNILGSKFDYMMFQKQADSKLSSKALNLLYQAERKYKIFDKLKSEEYIKELDELFEYLVLTNEDKRNFLIGLIYCISFRSEYTMMDAVTCVAVCDTVAEKMYLNTHDKEVLYYSAILHDAGMTAISKDILEAPRRLTDEEMKNLRSHVNILNTILKDRIDKDCLNVINAHHERGDGSGYPFKLRDAQMSLLQQILQVADVFTGLTAKRSYRPSKEKAQVIAILRNEADNQRLNMSVVRTVINYYEDIEKSVQAETKSMLSMYEKLQASYAQTFKKVSK